MARTGRAAGCLFPALNVLCRSVDAASEHGRLTISVSKLKVAQIMELLSVQGHSHTKVAPNERNSIYCAHHSAY